MNKNRTFLCIGLGEVLWDLLPGGRQLGGAPANFAYHAHALGASAFMVSRIGRDQLGQDLLARLQELGLPQETVQVDDHFATGTVEVTLSEQGLPEYTINEGVAWDHLAVTPSALAVVRQADAICFGTLAQRHEIARASLQQMAGAASAAAWRVLDLNLRQHFYSPVLIEKSLALSNVLKLNEDELDSLATMFVLGGDIRSRMLQLARRHNLRVVACTRGAQGSLLWSDGVWSDQPAGQSAVVDTVGAGDAFTAAMTLGLLAGWGLDEINRRASEVAAYVCSQPGATPKLPLQLCQPFRRCQSGGSLPRAATG
jgi:fructokinase